MMPQYKTTEIVPLEKVLKDSVKKIKKPWETCRHPFTEMIGGIPNCQICGKAF